MKEKIIEIKQALKLAESLIDMANDEDWRKIRSAIVSCDKLKHLVNLEVEKRIAERMSNEEIRIIALNFAPPVIYYGVTGGEDVNLSIRQDIIKLLIQLRSRLTNDSQKTEHTPQVTPQVPYKTEGGTK